MPHPNLQKTDYAHCPVCGRIAAAEWIEKNHEKVCKGNRAVANLIDGVTEVYLTTTYKLRNLM